MGNIIFVKVLSQVIMLPMLRRYANYGFHEYFDSSRKNLSYFFKQKSVMEMHVITKSTNLDA